MVRHICYKGDKLPIRISYYALKKLQEEMKREGGLGSIDLASMDVSALEALLFYGLERGAKVEGIPFQWRREDMEDLLDECYMEFIRIIPEFFPPQGAGEKKTAGEG